MYLHVTPLALPLASTAIDTQGNKGSTGGVGEFVRWPWTALIRCDLQLETYASWQAPPRCFLGDPTFVPDQTPKLSSGVHGSAARGGGTSGGGGESFTAQEGMVRPTSADAEPSYEEDEDRGWVLSLMYDAEQQSSYLLVFNAADVSAGPECTIDLMTFVPWSFHTTWFAGDFPGIIIPGGDNPAPNLGASGMSKL